MPEDHVEHLDIHPESAPPARRLQGLERRRNAPVRLGNRAEIISQIWHVIAEVESLMQTLSGVRRDSGRTECEMALGQGVGDLIRATTFLIPTHYGDRESVAEEA